MDHFDLIHTPLAGRNLIEASAGTGKTFTIAGLYLRLLVERRLRVEQILVVTFTEAATEELRVRIRRRLREAQDAFAAGASDDPLLAGLLAAVTERGEAVRLLTAALRSFDEAAIFTIHGFCQRVLQESPFESGSLFDTELVTEQEGLLREVAGDFWRLHLYTAPPAAVARAVAAGLSPAALLKLAGKRGSDPFLAVIPNLSRPELPATGAIDDATLDVWLLWLRRAFFAYLAEELPRRKRRANVRFFEDLLLDLHRALSGPDGALLAEAVGERYRAALIDEFQDTDPLQFRIFDTLFPTDDPETPLFLIGDPKQAIYSFRGADIFAYLEAAEGTEQRHTLGENWRSEPALIRGVNALFAFRAEPFLFREIGFSPVTPAERERELLTVDGVPDPSPFRLWQMGRLEAGKPINKGDAWEILPRAVAVEIARLLAEGNEGRLRIGGRPVQPGDMAVLVRKNRQARLVRRELASLGIPAVLRGAGNLFESIEAEEVLQLLAAVAEPGNGRLIRTALVTELVGVTGDGLARLIEDEPAWEEVLEEFRGYHGLWETGGCMAMTSALLARRRVRSRLLACAGGERRLTNILHCVETIHQAAVAGNLGMEGTIAWLAARIAEEPKREEHEIRLETDEAAVQLVTVHKSKGLEYPIVFCPFAWEETVSRDQTAVFHDGDRRLVIDIGSPELPLHRERAQEEGLAEALRLLYVAVTRARNRCYLVWGAFKDAGRSALHYLLHPEAAAVKGQVALDDGAIMADLARLATASGGAIAVEPLPVAAVAPAAPSKAVAGDFRCREFTGRIDGDWRVASFTSFASHPAGIAELPDRDDTAAGSGGEQPAADPFSIFSFPRGARAGIFLHEILERLDFAAGPAADVAPAVEEALRRHGFGRQWLPAVAGMVANVLRLPLPAPAGSFALADLKPGGWRTELEFYFPLRFVTAEALRDLACQWSGEEQPANLADVLGALRFRPVKGMVRGFIDLVCEHDGRYYLMDWKSNHLGNSAADYAPSRLREAMERNLYPLQYLLYSLALHRHLATRLPGYRYDRHFGGVFYLFLRGIDPARGAETGVFADRPPRELVEELERLLIESDRD
ncbi:MAG: exodeoxyribonuclease V subunit beta [Desulfuromonadales bacterium]|nr:MAG: exodeoxyribonuclease V subunit beta [Desulfuromonadales bacterium]